MPKKKSYITVKDQFCGSGGSSQGAKRAGAEIKVALNHWKLAIDTHNTNFPEAMHDCTDISASDPRRYPSTDILITSPECTNHSLAKGVKIIKKQMDMFASGKMDPSAERSRATMWDVPRFAEFHNYNAIIVENVVDARKWVMFDAWLQAMYSLNYLHRCVYHNSMHHHPTPQSRDRMYVVFWKKGNKPPVLDYTPPAYCPRCGKDILAIQTWKKPDVKFGKYKQQYVYCCPADGVIVEPYYYASFNCIDWSDPGTRIGDRDKPLAPNSVTRIQYGIDKYGDKPMIVVNYTPGYTKPVTEATATMTTNDHQAILQTPFIVKLEHSQRKNNVKSATSGLPTQNTRQSSMLIRQDAYVKDSDQGLPTQTTCQGMGFCTPFIVNRLHGQHPRLGPLVKSSEDPLSTQSTLPGLGVVSSPFLTEMWGNGTARPITEAAGTVTAGGTKHGIITTDSWNSFITQYYGKSKTTGITDPLGSVTTTDRNGILNYKKPNIEDCYYRMLKPPEIKLAMAFESDYVVLGNGRDQVKQLGNAVTPPVMEWLVRQVIQSLS